MAEHDKATHGARQAVFASWLLRWTGVAALFWASCMDPSVLSPLLFGLGMRRSSSSGWQPRF